MSAKALSWDVDVACVLSGHIVANGLEAVHCSVEYCRLISRNIARIHSACRYPFGIAAVVYRVYVVARGQISRSKVGVEKLPLGAGVVGANIGVVIVMADAVVIVRILYAATEPRGNTCTAIGEGWNRGVSRSARRLIHNALVKPGGPRPRVVPVSAGVVVRPSPDSYLRAADISRQNRPR